MTALIIVTLLISLQSCGNNSVTDNNESILSSAGTKASKDNVDNQNSHSIKLSLNLSFMKQSFDQNKMLESNVGNYFGNVTKIDEKIEPNQELDLQQIQPTGIFGLYISSDDVFELKNSDGMSLSSKTVLLEKCSFIDLKIKNPTSGTIHITGMIAGE